MGVHIKIICARAPSGTFALKSLSKLCHINVLKTVYYGLVFPQCMVYDFEKAVQTKGFFVYLFFKNQLSHDQNAKF